MRQKLINSNTLSRMKKPVPKLAHRPLDRGLFLCYDTLIHTNLPMNYKATVQLSYTSTSDGAIDCDDILPAENIKMEVPAEDLNIHQYFYLFNRFLRAVGFCDYNIMQGGVQLAFNDMRDQKEMISLIFVVLLSCSQSKMLIDNIQQNNSLTSIQKQELIQQIQEASKTCSQTGTQTP